MRSAIALSRNTTAGTASARSASIRGTSEIDRSQNVNRMFVRPVVEAHSRTPGIVATRRASASCSLAGTVANHCAVMGVPLTSWASSHRRFTRPWSIAARI
ncbi:hypothetical protein D3230_10720 [Leucobacter chromiireducens subsp. solipictus]|uniref:Uncharacterized protein n=1 Tax=Leucobacter chromiireducens subsp. solipictus TaxID=398235 RepID=A0ABS1SGP3_9MICO|nr:hypothetical protein [Leucobacter chromiireducens subsp. solipictus]